MIPKCFVINMPSAQERREGMTKSLQEIGLDFEFFEATNGRELTPDQEQQCLHQEDVVLPLRAGRKLIVKSNLIPSEIGCAFSHLRLYQHILDSGLERAVILEDDLQLHPDVLLALENLDKITEPWDVVHFYSPLGIKNLTFYHKYYFGSDKEHYFQRLGMHNPTIDAIHNQRRLITGTFLYVITRQACERLLEIGYPVRLPSDYLLGLLCYNELRIFRAFPLNHYVQFKDVPSTIGEGREHALIRA